MCTFLGGVLRATRKKNWKWTKWFHYAICEEVKFLFRAKKYSPYLELAKQDLSWQSTLRVGLGREPASGPKKAARVQHWTTKYLAHTCNIHFIFHRIRRSEHWQQELASSSLVKASATSGGGLARIDALATGNLAVPSAAVGIDLLPSPGFRRRKSTNASFSSFFCSFVFFSSFASSEAVMKE